MARDDGGPAFSIPCVVMGVCVSIDVPTLTELLRGILSNPLAIEAINRTVSLTGNFEADQMTLAALALKLAYFHADAAMLERAK